MRGGSREADAPNPVGEYAMSCLGRERIFEHFSREPARRWRMLRLNYATEMRYGVLVDIAQRVYAGRRGSAVAWAISTPSGRAMPCAMSLQALAHASVAAVRREHRRAGNAQRAALWPSSSASVCDKPRSLRRPGIRRRPVEQRQQAERSVRPSASGRRADDRTGSPTGSRRGGATLGKPTHFEDGRALLHCRRV